MTGRVSWAFVTETDECEQLVYSRYVKWNGQKSNTLHLVSHSLLQFSRTANYCIATPCCILFFVKYCIGAGMKCCTSHHKSLLYTITYNILNTDMLQTVAYARFYYGGSARPFGS